MSKCQHGTPLREPLNRAACITCIDDALRGREYRLTQAQWNAVTRARRTRQATLAVGMGLALFTVVMYLIGWAE